MRETAGVQERAGTPIHYWLAGHPRAPLLAFTHTAAMDHLMFEPQLAGLWDAGYRTLRWDMRGHGRSRPRGKLPLTLVTAAEDLQALLDKVSLGRQVCLVGHGFGGLVCQQIALQRADRVSALVMVGSRCLTLRRPGPWTTMAATTATTRWRLRTTSTIRHQIARAAAIVPAVQSYAFEATHRLGRRELLALRRAAGASLHAEMGFRIEQPLLLTHGEYDRTGRLARISSAWAARDPRCWYEVIARAGHHAHQDNPEAFNRLLLDFLATHVPVPRGIRS